MWGSIVRRFLPLIAATWITFLLAAPAHAAENGGASGDAALGGPADPVRSGALAYGTPVRQRPVARLFRVAPRRVRQGRRPKLRLRIDERGVDRVAARIVATNARTRRVAATIDLGTVPTGRAVTRRWPASKVPRVGRYVVRLHVTDPQGATLARASATKRTSRLEVRPRPKPKPKPQPQPQPRRQPTPPPPTPAAGSPLRPTFPVQGPFTWGGEASRFGAGRTSHTHQGQDLAAPEGTPLVSPLPGVVKFVDFQASGAGHYVVVDADDGRSLFFAHLQSGSITVAPGQRVGAGQGLGRVGSTGRSSGPHLHFEIWQGGWRDRGGHPIDPLPQLRAWAG